MKNNLRISNMVLTGKLPFKKKLNERETHKLILKAGYMIVNEDNSPIFMKKFPIRKKKEMSINKKEKMPAGFIWTSGAINITGALNRKEGDQVYEIILEDIKKHCRRVL